MFFEGSRGGAQKLSDGQLDNTCTARNETITDFEIYLPCMAY